MKEFMLGLALERDNVGLRHRGDREHWLRHPKVQRRLRAAKREDRR